MKNFIKKWLDIPEKCTHRECTHTCITQEEITKAVGELLQKYTNTVCVTCGKDIVAHYGGFYRDHTGKVFCSHECIIN
jgi:hypothetical protein